MSVVASRLNKIKPSPTIAVTTKAAELKAAEVHPWRARNRSGHEQSDGRVRSDRSGCLHRRAIAHAGAHSRGIEVTVRRAPIADDSLVTLLQPAPDPVLEYTLRSSKVSYLRLVGWLPGRVRIKRQALVQGSLALRDPTSARVLWTQNLGQNLIDRIGLSEVSLVEDSRYPELQSPVPGRNVDKVLEPVVVVAVVGGLVALVFQNRP